MEQIIGAIKALQQIAQSLNPTDFEYPVSTPCFGQHHSHEEIQAFEQEYALLLPRSFQCFLLECGSVRAMDIHNGYDLFGLSSIQHVWTQSGVPKRIRTQEGICSVLPVASDGGGNLFLLEYKEKQQCAVWKWNHEFPPDTSDTVNVIVEPRATSVVAESFAAFLWRVVQDWRAFIHAEDDWDFLSG